ncbi:MAG TPA: 2-dehydropantoate 2-reductase, partial [Chroococcales cyanobacterium]
MRILILGAGAIGGYFGARLIEGGANVSYLVRPGRAAQLKKDGLVVESCFGNLSLPLAESQIVEKATETYDLILLSCKAYDLDSAIEAIRPAVGPSTTVLPLLNGIRHVTELQKQFKEERVLGGFCIISSTLADTGKIIHFNNAHTLKFGEFSGEESERIKAIKAVFQPAKMDWKASPDISRDMWEKWVMIASLAATTCLMRASVGQVARSPGGKEF